MQFEVMGVQVEVEGLRWRRWRLRGLSLKLGGAGRGDVVRG